MNDVSRSFRGNSNAARDIAHHLHPYTNFKKHEESGPLTIVRGRGIYVTDDDGKEYIEGMAGLWSAALGFINERLATVAYEQMKQLPFYHAFNQRSVGGHVHHDDFAPGEDASRGRQDAAAEAHSCSHATFRSIGSHELRRETHE